MREQSRITNTIRNTTYGIGGQILSNLLNFVYRTVFIQILDANYLGISGLFSNILSMLSLAELGVGSAITFSLYKPLAEKDNQKLRVLMNFYSKTYKIIGVVVGLLGISVIPFLNYIIKDKPDISNLTIIYLLYLGDSVASYFFSYKRSIIIADQKSYINTINQNLFLTVRISMQILILILTRNFIFTLVVQVLCALISNISISYKSKQLYPFLNFRVKERLDIETKKELFRKIRAMFYHNIGSVVVLGTDNLLLSAFVGVYWVGIYSNYVLILNVVRLIIKQFSDSVVASIGNMTSLNDSDRSYNTFNILYLLNYWIYSFSAICLLVLLNPFITLWIGEKYLLEQSIVGVIVLNYYIGGMRQNVIAFRNSLGLFWNDRYKPIFESLINLIASIILLKYLGMVGVLLGTLISTITTSLWVEPYILYKHYFNKNIKEYFLKYFTRLIVTMSLAAFLQRVASIIFNKTWTSFILLLIVCIILSNALMFALYFNSKEFKYLATLVKLKIKR